MSTTLQQSIQNERRATIAPPNETLNAVARKLGATLKPLTLENYWCCEIENPEFFLHVRVDSHKHRFEISAGTNGNSVRDLLSYDENKAGYVDGVRIVGAISVATTRSADAIASEVTRRLLPTAKIFWKRAAALKASREDYAAKSKALADRCSVAAGFAPLDTRSNNNRYALSLPANITEGRAYGDVTVEGDSVEIRIRYAEPDKAVKILEFLRTL